MAMIIFDNIFIKDLKICSKLISHVSCQFTI